MVTRCPPSPGAIPSTVLYPQIVECIRQRVDRRLPGPRQQTSPSIPARAAAAHVDEQERGARQARGHQQPQGGRQKEALWVCLPQAPGGRGHRVRALGAHRELASHAHVAGRAGADKAGEVGVATASVRAGARGAGVGALPTVAPAETQRARAAPRAAALHARAAVGTGATCAVVQVMLAARPREARAAAAAQGVAQVQAEAACGETESASSGPARPPRPLRPLRPLRLSLTRLSKFPVSRATSLSELALAHAVKTF